MYALSSIYDTNKMSPTKMPLLVIVLHEKHRIFYANKKLLKHDVESSRSEILS